MCGGEADRVEEALEGAVPAFEEEVLEGALERAERERREGALDALEALEEAREVEGGKQLALRERRELVERILGAFEPAKLCLAPCSVETSAHPGLHMGSGPGFEDMDPVCAIPAEVPHGFHMCLPGDRRRYVKCPLCDEVVGVRGKKRHVEAHLGVNKTSPDERRAYLVEVLGEWLEARPSWGFERFGGSVVRDLAKKCILKNRRRSGSSGIYNGWYRKQLEAACEEFGLPVPPLTYRQAKRLAEKGDQPEPRFTKEPTREDKKRVMDPPTEGQEGYMADLLEEIRDAEGGDLLEGVELEVDTKREASRLIDRLKDVRDRARQRASRRGRREEREEDPSEHRGGVGERLRGVVVTVVGVYEYESRWGQGRVFRMRDVEGNVLVWFTGSYPMVEEGVSLESLEGRDRAVCVRATVKEHSSFDGVPQTVVKRVHVEGFAEEGGSA